MARAEWRKKNSCDYLMSDDIVARRFAASGAAWTTGSPMKSGAESHLASLGKTATTSQRIRWCSQQSTCEAARCVRNSVATRWFLSQNCVTRGSATRRCTRRLGRNQSVGRIGSHTTKTFNRSEWFCFSICPIAEAPRKQTGQVGDTSTSRRSPPAARSNCAVNWAKLLPFREVTLPPLGPHRYQPPRSRSATTTSNSKFLVFISHPARILAAIWGNRISMSTMAVATQKIATLTRLRLWHCFRKYN